MTCQVCGEHPHQETLKHGGKTLRVCRPCGNGIRDQRRPKRVEAREKRKAEIVAVEEEKKAAEAEAISKTLKAQGIVPEEKGGGHAN